MDEEELERQAMQSGVVGQMAQGQAQQSQAQYYMQEQEKGLADAQLEVDSIKEEIYHLLKQDKLKQGEDRKVDWVEIEKESDRTLSEWGVDRIMQTIHFYINKNTLLSNFSEEHIKRLMLRFIREINDLILLKYQVLFRQPTFEECKKRILDKLENEKKMRVFALEMFGKKANEEEIKKELLNEMEKTLEREMEKTRTEQRKEKLRDYGLIIAQLEIIVFATLNRAYRGEERGSLRRHMTVSELIGNKPQSMHPEQKGGFFGWKGR
jgi:hypothetical protein